MSKQRGFIFTPMLAIYGIVGGLVIALAAGLWVQTQRLERERIKCREFSAQVRALGEQAEKAAAARVMQDKANKEKADAENDRLNRELRALAKRLRERNASGSYLPAPSASAGSADTACFDRAQLDRAIRDLDRGVQGLVVEGAEAVTDLNSAKQWAQRRYEPISP